MVVVLEFVIQDACQPDGGAGFLGRVVARNGRGGFERLARLFGFPHTHIHLAFGIVNLVKELLVFLVFHHPVEQSFQFGHIGMLEVGARGDVEAGVEFHFIRRAAAQHLLIVFGGSGAFVLILVYLAKDVADACFLLPGGMLLECHFQEVHAFLVLFLRQCAFGHGKIEVKPLAGGKIVFGVGHHQLV